MNDERKEIVITQSLIKKIIVHGNEINVCPSLLYKTRISKQYRESETFPMTKGKFFEYLSLGSGADEDDMVTDLPRIRGDKKSADQVRIEAQATVFLNAVEKYGANINETQVFYRKEWEHDNNIWSDEYRIIIAGTIDFKSPILANAINGNGERSVISYKEAIHDLKLTADVTTTFGPFAWGSPWNMDHIQACIYNYITSLPFFYWVFDYKTKPEFKLIYKEIDSISKMEMHEAIRKTIETMIEFESNDWAPVPYYSLCKNCIVTEQETCDMRISKPDIIIV